MNVCGGGQSAQHLAALLAETLDFMQEIEDEFQPGFVHPACGAQVLDSAELAQAFRVKHTGVSCVGGQGADETLFLVMEDRLGFDASQLGDDLHGITSLGFPAVNGEISEVRRWIEFHFRVE